MKKRIVSFVVAALIIPLILYVASIAHAQSPATSSPSVTPPVPTDGYLPSNSREYQALFSIQKAGIAVTYPKGSTAGKGPMTRQNFASAIADQARLLGENPPEDSNLAALRQDLETKLEQNLWALDALRSLVDEFSPELKALDIDAAGAKARLDALKERVAALEEEQRRVKIGDLDDFFETSLSDIVRSRRDGTSYSQPVLPDTVPADYWQYQAAQELLKAGFPIEDPSGRCIAFRLATRQEFAEGIARILWVFNSGPRYAGRPGAVQTALLDILRKNRQALGALRALVIEFQPELQQLGQDVPAVKSMLDSLEDHIADNRPAERRVKWSDVPDVLRGYTITDTIDTKPLDKNGYRTPSAGLHPAGDAHLPKHRLQRRAVHSRRHHHRRRTLRIRH